MKANVIKWLTNRGYSGPSFERISRGGAYNWKYDKVYADNNIGTLMHELAHSTGHDTRLSRSMKNSACTFIDPMIFGFPKAVVKEESVAILSTFFLLLWFHVTNRKCYKSMRISMKCYGVNISRLLTWDCIRASIKASVYVIRNYFKGGTANEVRCNG